MNSPAVLERHWDEYWRKWDEDSATGQSDWSQDVRRAYRVYRQTIEGGMRDRARQLTSYEEILLPHITTTTPPTDDEASDRYKVKRLIHDIKVASIEARHSVVGIAKEETKQKVAEANRQFNQSTPRRSTVESTEEQKQRQERLARMSPQKVREAREIILQKFTDICIEAWITLLAAEKENADGKRDKWPKYPPSLFAGSNDNERYDN